MKRGRELTPPASEHESQHSCDRKSPKYAQHHPAAERSPTEATLISFGAADAQGGGSSDTNDSAR